MDIVKARTARHLLDDLVRFLQKFVLRVVSVGPLPNHIAFIMDGNRRYAKKCNLIQGAGHKAGFLSLVSMLMFCYELGIRYVTIYAFSIDNFNRHPQEIESLMELMQEKIEGLVRKESIVNLYGVRVLFVGNLKLLTEPVRLAAERAMLATAKNSKAILSICVAYTSTNEILNAVKESCDEKRDEISILEETGAGYGLIKLGGLDDSEQIIKRVDIERYIYAPDPDIVIRTSGETRLSNFLLWQTAFCYLYSPAVLWPEIGFHHFIWAILNFQRNHLYLRRKQKQS